LDEHEFIIANTLIGNLDESGYLNRELESIVDDLAFSANVFTDVQEISNLLQVIQELDPAGVGARNLQECLLLQIQRKQDGDITRYTAKIILEQFFEEFTKKHYDKIAKKLEIDDEDLKEAIAEILKLNPKPGGSMIESAKNHQQIIPDFMIVD
jgi:RNA polymerase sigma-54 factor